MKIHNTTKANYHYFFVSKENPNVSKTENIPDEVIQLFHFNKSINTCTIKKQNVFGRETEIDYVAVSTFVLIKFIKFSFYIFLPYNTTLNKWKQKRLDSS